MKEKTRKTVKKAMQKIQEAIDLLEQVNGENEEIDTAYDNLGFAMADLEYELNS
jgi:predicted RNase H-like HicB family nuclease